MANSTYGRVWIADTIGIITRKGIRITKIMLVPNTHTDSATFYYWDTADVIATGVSDSNAINGDITGNDTLTLDGGTRLPSTITDGSIFEIVASNGSTNNVGKPMLVQTAGNNLAVAIHKIPDADKWTNETDKFYSWKTYQNRLAFNLVSLETKKEPLILDFGPRGYWFPNLALETISSAGNTKVYIYTV